MAGTPNGDERNASTMRTMPPTNCPVMNSMTASSTSSILTTQRIPAATQARNPTNAASSARVSQTGAAIILSMSIDGTSVY